jgi:hypothetical protein
MNKLTKEEALAKIEELKSYVAQEEKQEEKGFIIEKIDGSDLYVSKTDNVKDAVLEAISNEANLHEANLYEADLSEADLSGADLSEADLSEADLSEADLSGADLSEADLSEANLHGADLHGANLREADLCSAKFYGRGGTVKLKPNQVTDFLNALGFQVE